MRKKIIGMVSILFVLGSVFTGCGTGAAAGDGAEGVGHVFHTVLAHHSFDHHSLFHGCSSLILAFLV